RGDRELRRLLLDETAHREEGRLSVAWRSALELPRIDAVRCEMRLAGGRTELKECFLHRPRDHDERSRLIEQLAIPRPIPLEDRTRVHVETVKVHGEGLEEAKGRVEGLDGDVPELDENGVSARAPKRAQVHRGDLVCLAVPAAPVGDRAPTEARELGGAAR